MYRSLYFKIVLIFVMLMITVMMVVGAFLLGSVSSFYEGQFSEQMNEVFTPALRTELSSALRSPGSGAADGAADEDPGYAELDSMLRAYSTALGIDKYRSYYILDLSGKFITGSDEESGRTISVTPNLMTAMKGGTGSSRGFGTDYSDYAFRLDAPDGETGCIVCVRDSQQEMRQLSWRLFSIILTSLFLGLGLAVVLSFFLARAITSPIRSLTREAQLLAAGKGGNAERTEAKDEIGTLTNTFNYMGKVLRRTLGEVSDERMKLETVFSYLDDAVFAFGENGKIINVNPTARRLAEKADVGSEMTFEKLLAVLGVEYAGEMLRGGKKEAGKESKKEGKKENGGDRFVRDVRFGDSVFDINLGRLRYTAEGETHNGTIVVMHDITDRYELDKAQREFVANVSHELRTPLTSIKGAAETVLLNPDMSPEFRESFLEMAIEESDRMQRIISDLLTLSRFDNKKIRWEIVSFDLCEMLEGLILVMSPQAKEKGQRLVTAFADGIPVIRGDKGRLEQVFINILSNAVKYTPEDVPGGGEITVSAESFPDRITVSIADNGIGVSEEDRKRIFERFYRVDKSRTSDTGGTGLGLAIAKEIVEAHGGSIAFENRSDGKSGSVVTVSLPPVCVIRDENAADGAAKGAVNG